MKKRYWFIITVVLLVGFAILALRPVPIAKEADCLSVSGTVTDIYEGGEKDLVIKLRGQNKIYYINRGLERGLDIQQLKTALIDQQAVLKYPDYWTPLDPGRSSIHISKIENGGRTVFSELE